MAIIYHITTTHEWEAAKESGLYKSNSLELEGFIHCSEESQISGVLHRYFEVMKELVKLQINTEKLQAELKYELSPTINEKFPHIYGPININAVEKILPL